MIRSDIISKARTNVNDTDSTNPFHTDAKCHGILDDWALEIASEVNLPQSRDSISFAQGDGGDPDNGKALNTDILAITGVVMFKGASSNYEHRLLHPRTEEEMDALDAAWKDRTEQGSPSYYIVSDAITAAAASFTGRNITVDKPCDAAYTMEVKYIQLPAASTDGTKSPQFNPTLHKSGEYYLCWHMMVPRDVNRAEYFRGLYERAKRKAKTLSPFIQDDQRSNIWGVVPSHEQ